jgi:hypothetical protein
MRYPKGSIALSTTRDYPLLRQVLDSGFISHNQLFEFLKLDYCVSSRNAFNNRMLRLLSHGLLTRHDIPFAHHEFIYSISRTGALRLVGTGEYCFPCGNTAASHDRRRGIDHFLELNEIHLALKRSGSLVYWTSELAIRSRIDLAGSGYWKYYDAVVVVRLAGLDYKFALEYERTPKAARQYTSIRDRIERESTMAHFLYLAPNHDLLGFIADKLRECNRAVYFGLFRDFLEQTMSMPVRQSGSPVSTTLTTALSQGKAIQRAGNLFSDIAL